MNQTAWILKGCRKLARRSAGGTVGTGNTKLPRKGDVPVDPRQVVLAKGGDPWQRNIELDSGCWPTRIG
jgi:hypothetical protein